MYARLNVLVEDINALEISPLTTSDIIRKVLHSLHKPKYNIVIVLLYEKDLATFEVGEVIGKIRSHEMFLMGEVVRKIRSHEMFLLGEVDPPQVKKDLALKAKE